MEDKAKEILARELETLKQELIQKHNELNMKASGAWETSLEVEVTPSISGIKGAIKGLDYSYYMQHGRADGKMPPLQALEEWVKNKGLKPIEDKMKTSSLAFLIARKIAREGTKRYQNKGNPEFIDAVITPERMHQIAELVGFEYSLHITSQIINLFDNLKK